MTAKSTISISGKDEKLRDYILHNRIFIVTLMIGTPLALHQSLYQLFKILDSLMASYIDATAASTVAYLSQISLIINAVGLGLAAGSGLKISSAYGEGNYELVKKRVNVLLALSILFGAVLLLGILPFVNQFLRFANTPEEFIAAGRSYFILELFSIVLGFFNNVYVAIERAKGNSRHILRVNLLSLILKLILSALCIYVWKKGITYIAAATLLSQLVFSGFAIHALCRRDTIFAFSWKHITLRRRDTWPLISLSLPIMVEKSAFHLGKAVVNSMITMYGSLTVGALGISNTICGISTTPFNGYQDGAASVMSQNIGAGNIRRALDAFKSLLLINLILGTCFLIPSLYFDSVLTGFFAASDEVFHSTLLSVYRYDIWGILPLAINASVLALLYGFGYTRLTLLINFCRVFLFRIPVLWWMQHYTSLGSESAGIIMIVSNVLTMLLAVIVAIVFIRHICRKYHTPFFQKNFHREEELSTL